MRHRSLALTFALLCGAAACGDEVTQPDGPVQVRVVNASPMTASADLLVGDQTVAQAVAFQGPGQCVELSAGVHTLTFRVGTQTVATVREGFVGGGRYSVVLFNETATSQQAAVLADLFPAPAAGVVALRLANVSGEPGDVFVTTPAGTVTGAPDAAFLSHLQITPPLPFAEAETRARLLPLSESSTPIADVTLPALPNRVGTVFFTPAAAAGGRTGFVVEPCPAAG